MEEFEAKVKAILATKGRHGWDIPRFAQALAKRKGEPVTPSAATQIMRSKNPHIKTVRMVAEALGVNPAYFFTGRPAPRRMK